MNDKQLIRAFKRDNTNPLFWGAMTPGEPERMQAAIDGTVNSAQRWAGGVALAIVAAMLLCYARPGASMSEYIGLAVVTGFMCLVSSAFVALTMLTTMTFLTGWLEPLSAYPQMCREVLDALRIPAVVEYRDLVVGTGRELLVGDYHVIARLSKAGDQELLRASQRETCQKVHGILHSEAAPA